MASLIMQRLALDSQRTAARVELVLVAVWLGLILPSLGQYPDAPWIPILALATRITGLVHGMRRLRRVRQAVSAFEAEHGTDAGVQKPV